MSRYGIDTNVLVRYIVQDDLKQSMLATKFLEKNCTVDQPGFISHIVLAELVWVLRRAYGYSKEQICDIVEKVLGTAEFEIESSMIAWEALHNFRQSKVDYADCLLGLAAISAGCKATATFDKNAGKQAAFLLLK